MMNNHSNSVILIKVVLPASSLQDPLFSFSLTWIFDCTQRKNPQIKTFLRIWVSLSASKISFFIIHSDALKLIMVIGSYVLSLLHNFVIYWEDVISLSPFVEGHWCQEVKVLAWGTVQYCANNRAWKNSQIFWIRAAWSAPKAMLYIQYKLMESGK